MPKEEPEETDEELKALQEELDLLEDKKGGVGSSKKSDNAYRFNRDLLTAKHTVNIGNLRKEEVGEGRLSLRGWLNIGLYSKAEGLNVVSDYCNAKSDNITRSSLSLQGFQQKMFRTDIKKQSVEKPKATKRRWFGKNKEEENP